MCALRHWLYIPHMGYWVMLFEEPAIDKSIDKSVFVNITFDIIFHDRTDR